MKNAQKRNQLCLRNWARNCFCGSSLSFKELMSDDRFGDYACMDCANLLCASYINLATKYAKPITQILKSTRLAHLVHLRLPELVRALVDPDVGGLHVLLDRVDHRALLVHHRRQVLEDGVHVDDVRLQGEEENSIFE